MLNCPVTNCPTIVNIVVKIDVKIFVHIIVQIVVKIVANIVIIVKIASPSASIVSIFDIFCWRNKMTILDMEKGSRTRIWSR